MARVFARSRGPRCESKRTSWPSLSFGLRYKATHFEPHQQSEGVEHVFVNGVARVRDEVIVDALPGRVLARTIC
jgi:hypothetical protein